MRHLLTAGQILDTVAVPRALLEDLIEDHPEIADRLEWLLEADDDALA